MEVRIEHLRKSYGGTEVLQDVSFAFAGPGVAALMAPSGAGKTTLARILMGLEKPDSGSVRGVERARFAAVFQEDRLLENLDAAGNLRFVLGADYDEAQAEALLSALGLDPDNPKPAGEYSGGMRRRLALARAMLAKSDVLVLDEPLTGLDSENRQKALACIQKAAEEKLVFLITHETEDAAALDAQRLLL